MIANLLVNTLGFSSTVFTLYLVLVDICLALIFFGALISIILVLFQKSNSDGIQGITASSETFFGKHKGKSIDEQLKKWTWICLAVTSVLAIVVYIINLILNSVQ
jgi:preprotein translocase subunit SecG